MVSIMEQNKNILLALLLIASVSLGFLANVFFENSSKNVYIQLNEKEGQVAGISKTKVENLTDRFKIIPGANIVSIDTTNDTTFITLESDKPENEIKKFYDENMQQQKESVEVIVTGSIIKITLKN